MSDLGHWVVAAYNPLSDSSEIAIGILTKDTMYEFGVWTGSSWATRPSAITARVGDNRGIDVAFEKDTGKALYIFNQNANPTQLSWRTWTSSGGFSSVTAETGSSGSINFMQLQADPNSNDIMAIYSDASADLFHRKWDGSLSSWSTLGTALEDSLSNTAKTEPFMFAWHTLPTAVALISFTATEYSSGILLQWKTGYEVDNLGFHVYREEGGNLYRLTPELVAGSALLAGSGTHLTSGHSYQWWDFSSLSPHHSVL